MSTVSRLGGTTNSPNRGGRPRRQGATEAILEATVTLAAERGLKELTLDAVAARAGVGRPTIYRRWSSKEALLQDATEMLVEQLAETFKLRLLQTGNVRDDLVAWTCIAIEQVQGDAQPLIAMIYSLREAGVASDILERATDITAGIAKRGN